MSYMQKGDTMKAKRIKPNEKMLNDTIRQITRHCNEQDSYEIAEGIHQAINGGI